MLVYYVTHYNSRWVQAIEPGYEFQMPNTTRKAIFITRIWVRGWCLKCWAGLEVKPPELSALIGDDTKLCRCCNRGSCVTHHGGKSLISNSNKIAIWPEVSRGIASPCWLIISFVCEEQTSHQCPLKSSSCCVRAEEPIAAWAAVGLDPNSRLPGCFTTLKERLLWVCVMGEPQSGSKSAGLMKRLQGQYCGSDSFTPSCPFGTLEHPGWRNLLQDHW